MSKGKPRQDPDKPQNRYGRWCQWYEDDGKENGSGWCIQGGHTSICEGNPHNCVKVKYHLQAARSDMQKIEGIDSGNQLRAWKKKH